MMTRYEFAAVVYRAIMAGAASNAPSRAMIRWIAWPTNSLQN